MLYGGTGDTYNYYGQNERGEHGNENAEAEPEYERHTGAPQAPPGHVFPNTQSYTPAPNAFVQGYPPVLPPVMNPYANTAPVYPQQPGCTIANNIQQNVLAVYPAMGTSQVPGIQSSPYPVQPHTKPIDARSEASSQDNPQEGVVVHESQGRLLESLACKRKIILCTIGVTLFIIISIVRAIAEA